MKYKEDVQRDPVHPEMYYARGVVDTIHRELFATDAVCTSSVRTPTPGGSSFHPLGLADDYRTRDLSIPEQKLFAARVRLALPKEFDVLLEGPASVIPRYQNRVAHLHVELDVQ